jgi:hypothetical protein
VLERQPQVRSRREHLQARADARIGILDGFKSLPVQSAAGRRHRLPHL